MSPAGPAADPKPSRAEQRAREKAEWAEHDALIKRLGELWPNYGCFCGTLEDLRETVADLERRAERDRPNQRSSARDEAAVCGRRPADSRPARGHPRPAAPPARPRQRPTASSGAGVTPRAARPPRMPAASRSDEAAARSMTDRAPGTNPPPAGRAVRAAIWLPGLAVALGAAAATAHGLYEVTLAARVPAGIAWLYPLITDGLALVAYAATARLTGPAARYAWTVVVTAAGLSGLAQAAYLAGGPAVEVAPALRFGVGAWPAIAAAVVAHLLYLLATDDPAQPEHGSASPRVFDPAPFSTRAFRARCSAASNVQPEALPDGVQPTPSGLGEAADPDAAGDAAAEASAPRRGAVTGPGPRRGGRAAARPAPRRLADRHRARDRRRGLPRHRRRRAQSAARATAAPAPDQHHRPRPHRRGPTMTTQQPITTTTSKNQEPRRKTKNQDHFPTPITTPNRRHRHDQQDTETKRSRERSEDAHLGITIRGSGPASGRPRTSRRSAAVDLRADAAVDLREVVRMLSVASGYSPDYLLNEVATGRENYYTGAVAEGEPPGRWWGAGAEKLGLSGLVDAQDMRALYERFLDPRARRLPRPGAVGRGARPSATPAGATPTEDELYAAALEREPDASR